MDRARATMVQGLTGSGRLLLVGDVNQVPCHLSHASRFAVYGALTCPLLRLLNDCKHFLSDALRVAVSQAVDEAGDDAL